jgi:hypothetical protein
MVNARLSLEARNDRQSRCFDRLARRAGQPAQSKSSIAFAAVLEGGDEGQARELF